MKQIKSIHSITKTIVDIMFFLGILCVVGVPLLVELMIKYFGYDSSLRIFLNIILVIAGVSAVYLLYNLRNMFRVMKKKNPFDERNIKSFSKMAISCAVIAVTFLVKCFVDFTVATFFIVVVFVVGSLFCLTLRDLFAQAAYYKEDHDFTI